MIGRTVKLVELRHRNRRNYQTIISSLGRLPLSPSLKSVQARNPLQSRTVIRSSNCSLGHFSYFVNELIEDKQQVQHYHAQSHHQMLARESMSHHAIPSAYRRHEEDQPSNGNNYRNNYSNNNNNNNNSSNSNINSNTHTKKGNGNYNGRSPSNNGQRQSRRRSRSSSTSSRRRNSNSNNDATYNTKQRSRSHSHSHSRNGHHNNRHNNNNSTYRSSSNTRPRSRTNNNKSSPNGEYKSNTNTNTNQNNNHNNNSNTYHNRSSDSNETLKKKIISLQAMDNEIGLLIQNYETSLGTDAFYPTATTFLIPTTDDNGNNDENKNGIKNENKNKHSIDFYNTIKNEKKKEWLRKFSFQNNDSSTTTSGNNDIITNLIQTEDEYKKICLTLRQLVVKWSRLRVQSKRFVAKCLSSGEHQSSSNNYNVDNNDDDLNHSSNARVNLSSMPPDNALNYSILLEILREQRAELIQTAIVSKKQHDGTNANTGIDNGSGGGGMLKWITDQVTMLTSSSNYTPPTTDNDTSPYKTIDDLKAHVSPKYTTNIAHYNILMRSFVQWRQTARSVSPTDRENQFNTTLNSLESILSLMERCSATTTIQNQDVGESTSSGYKEGGNNPNCIPDRSIYHILMQYYQLDPTLENAKQSMTLLQSMIDKQKEADTTNEKISAQIMDYWPTPHSFNIVLVAFRDIAQNSKDKDEKLEAWSHFDRILSEMETFIHNRNNDSTSTTTTTTTTGNMTNDPLDKTAVEDENSKNVLELTSRLTFPYHTALQLLGSIGEEDFPDYYDTIDSIMVRMMGKDSYYELYTDEEADLPQTIDCKILSNLVYYFSSSKERAYIERSKVILNKMQKMRNACLKKENDELGEKIIWDTNYPDFRSYNSYIIGLLHCALNKKESKQKVRGSVKYGSKYNDDQLKEDAIYATGLLDSMMENESSMPSPITYYRLLRLWSMCKSKESGEKGEEILSRMNILSTYVTNKEKFEELSFRSYQSALESWDAATIAQYPGGAKRAAQLLDRVLAQHSSESFGLGEDDEYLERKKKEKGFLYSAALRCCADTTLESDKKDALKIAIEIFNKMQDEKLSHTPYTYVLLLQCCSFAPTEEQQRNVSKYIFDIACEEGYVSKHVLYSLRQVNKYLFKAYEELPKHVANIRD